MVLVKLSFLVSCNDPESYSSCYVSPGLVGSNVLHVDWIMGKGEKGECLTKDSSPLTPQVRHLTW